MQILPSDPDAPPGPPSSEIRARVVAAVARQEHRLRETPWRRNGHVAGGAIETLLPVAPDVAAFWRGICRGRRLSGRGAARVRRVARTIADLKDHAAVSTADVELAASLREDFQ